MRGHGEIGAGEPTHLQCPVGARAPIRVIPSGAAAPMSVGMLGLVQES